VRPACSSASSGASVIRRAPSAAAPAASSASSAERRVASPIDRLAEWPGPLRGLGQRVGHRLQRGRRSRGQPVAQPRPDQPQPRERVVRDLDPVRVHVRDRDAEVRDVLRRLPDHVRVQPPDDHAGAVAEDPRGDPRALGFRDRPVDGLLDRHDPLAQRQRLQHARLEAEPREGVRRRAGPGRGEAQPPRQPQQRPLDLAEAEPAISLARATICTVPVVVPRDCASFVRASTVLRLERGRIAAPAFAATAPAASRAARAKPESRRLARSTSPESRASRARPCRWPPRTRPGPAARRSRPGGRRRAFLP